MRANLRTGFLKGAAALALASAWAGGANAQTTAEGEDAVRLAQLDAITVYATRNPLPAFDYPGQVTVIGRDIIEDFDPSKISDLFDAVPGARFDGGPRRTGEVPSIRGLEGEGVLVLFDGARQSFLSGHDGRFFIDPSLLKAVEVVRGPTSALYGSGALGGVIALRTIDAGDFLGEGERAGVMAGGGFQSVNDEWRLSSTGVWRSADGGFDVVGNFTWREAGDIRLGNGLDLTAEDQIASSLLKATARPADAVTASVSWIRYRGDSVDPNNPQGAGQPAPGNELVNRDISSDTFQGVVNIAPDTDLLDLNIVAYRTNNEVVEAERGSPRTVARAVETTGFSLDNRTIFALGRDARIVFTYGGELYTDEQSGRDNMTADGRRGGVPDATGKFYGAFAQAELSVASPVGAFALTPGVRWDRFANETDGAPDTKDSAVSPKIGLTWKPVPELIFFGAWGEAFRAPSFNEIYADGVHFQIPNFQTMPPGFATNFFIANPDLVPEESETWEAGAGVDFKGVFGRSDRLTAKASYYRSDVTDLIDLEVNIPAGCFGAPFPPCGSGEAFGNFSRYVNVTNARLEGVEVEASYDSPLVYARANFATIDGENTDTGGYVGVLSPNRFFVDAGVKAGRDFRVGARVTVAGDFDKANDPTLFRDGYAKGDVYAVYQPAEGPLKGLRLDLGVDNVTDADYEVVAAGVSQPGRNVKLAASWRQTF